MSTEFIKQCLYTLNNNLGSVPLGAVVWLPFEPVDWDQFRGKLQDSGWFLCDGSYVNNVNVLYPEFAKYAKLTGNYQAKIITGLNPAFKFNVYVHYKSGVITYTYDITDVAWAQSFDQYLFAQNTQEGASDTYGVPLYSDKYLNKSPYGKYYHVTTTATWQFLFLLCCNLGRVKTPMTDATANIYSGSTYVTSNTEIIGKNTGYQYAITLADPSNWPTAEDCPTMLEALEKLAATDIDQRLELFNSSEYRLSQWFTTADVSYLSETPPAILSAPSTAITKLSAATAGSSDSEKYGLAGTAKPATLRLLRALRDGMVLASKVTDQKFKLPDLLNYRTLMGYSTKIGIEEVGTETSGAVPNIKGDFMGTGRPGASDTYGTYNKYDSGPFAISSAAAAGGEIAASGHNGKSIYGYVHTFDPSKISQVYQTVDMVVPNGVRAIPVMRLG